MNYLNTLRDCICVTIPNDLKCSTDSSFAAPQKFVAIAPPYLPHQHQWRNWVKGGLKKGTFYYEFT